LWRKVKEETDVGATESNDFILRMMGDESISSPPLFPKGLPGKVKPVEIANTFLQATMERTLAPLWKIAL
jgi:hypothetical protein